MGTGIARREAKRLVNMAFSFRATTHKILTETNNRVGVRPITIQRQRLLALSNALRRPVGNNLDQT